jgi:hypothetical protein
MQLAVAAVAALALVRFARADTYPNRPVNALRHNLKAS